MPRYRVLEPTFLRAEQTASASMHPAGATISYSGVPGNALEPLDDEARQAKALQIGRGWRQLHYHGSGHVTTNAIARSLGTGAPRDVSHAESMIDAFVEAWLPKEETTQ